RISDDQPKSCHRDDNFSVRASPSTNSTGPQRREYQPPKWRQMSQSGRTSEKTTSRKNSRPEPQCVDYVVARNMVPRYWNPAVAQPSGEHRENYPIQTQAA